MDNHKNKFSNVTFVEEIPKLNGTWKNIYEQILDFFAS